MEEQERYDQVWKAFLHVLEELNVVFEDQGLTVDDFLALLLSGMQLSQYRTIPATVDVVMVQSYDLIEPLTAPYVYAIGLTQERFQRLLRTPLLSEEERQQLNEATPRRSRAPGGDQRKSQEESLCGGFATQCSHQPTGPIGP